jgi:hypothetical protein
MNEDKDRATALDVLQSSDLNARLLRRLTASPGVIDVQMLRQIPARLMGLLAPLVSLFDDLMARYGIDDGSMGNQPLIMEQPWMQNVNSYLTNYNSFSSTTNQFISIPATDQKSGGEVSVILPPGPSLLEEASTSSRAETFQIHRRPARRAWESDLTIAGAFERNPVLKPADVSTPAASVAAPVEDEREHDKDEQSAVSETADLKSGLANQTDMRVIADDADTKIEPTKAIASSIAAPGELPLARAQVQSKLPDDGIARAERKLGPANQIEEAQRTGGLIQPVPAKTSQLVLAKAGALKQTAPPRNQSTEGKHTSAEQSTHWDKEMGMRPKDVSREIAAHSSLRSKLESFDLVQSQAASSQLQKRATDFVWRRSADVPDARELTSVDSSARLKAVADSLGQLPRTSQTITPESPNPKSEHGAGSRLMTERIVRNISRKLLIERERRGY